jgi:hypothetical protein
MNNLQELIKVHTQNRHANLSNTTYRGVKYDIREYSNKVLVESSQVKRSLKYRGVEVAK